MLLDQNGEVETMLFQVWVDESRVAHLRTRAWPVTSSVYIFDCFPLFQLQSSTLFQSPHNLTITIFLRFELFSPFSALGAFFTLFTVHHVPDQQWSLTSHFLFPFTPCLHLVHLVTLFAASPCISYLGRVSSFCSSSLLAHLPTVCTHHYNHLSLKAVAR